MVGRPEERREGLQEEEEPARREQLVQRGRVEDGRNDEQVHEHAEQRDEADPPEPGEPDRPPGGRDEEVDRIHAEHHEIDVRDPDDVDHAEDEVEAERQEREHAAEEDAVHGGLDEKDRPDHQPTQSPR